MAQGDVEQQALLRRARESLHVGASPETAFAELAVATSNLRVAAIAVCVAAGTPRADAEKRWATDGEPLVAEIRDGEGALLGEILEMAGFFDFHRTLDEHELQIRHELDQAFAAAGRWRSGVAHSLIRQLETGRFVDALASMTAHGPRRGVPTPSTYWTHLLAAANLLTSSDDGRIEAIVLLCRQHLDQYSASDTDSSG